METRARTRPMLRRAGLLAALTALLVPAVAGTATADAAKRSKKRSPVVTKISPKNAFVGETLTIRGRYFRRGVNKNTVAFKPSGKKVVFVKAEKGTTKLLKVTLPKRLEKSMTVQNGTPVPTRMRVRVLAARFGKSFTRLSRSPVIGPERPPAPPTPPTADPDADCDGDGQKNKHDGDDDNDLLGDAFEKQLKLDGCKADTDGDGVEDGYEYVSARDLNADEHGSGVVFYPEKLPYPNALDGTDGGADHDGDSLTLAEEYQLWLYTQAQGAVRTLDGLTYSAGMQHSAYTVRGDGRREPSLAAAGYPKQLEFLNWAGAAGYATVYLVPLGEVAWWGWDGSPNWWAPRTGYDIRDMNRSGVVEPAPNGAARRAEVVYYDLDGDGVLDDGERDEDADGLTNFDETRACGVRGNWDALYNKETAYYLQAYANLRHDNPDTDGDGVRDGADDQDHDDVPNVMECSRIMATGGLGPDPRPSDGDPPPNRPLKGFVNPYNPCLPHPKARSCRQYLNLEDVWAPFNAKDKYYYIWN